MQIDKHQFLKAVVYGFEAYDHLKGMYFKDSCQAGCSIGVAAKMLNVAPQLLALKLMEIDGWMDRSPLYDRIVSGNDAADNKHHAIYAVKQALNDLWPEGVTIDVKKAN